MIPIKINQFNVMHVNVYVNRFALICRCKIYESTLQLLILKRFFVIIFLKPLIML